jgi:hypothetical protein
MQLERVYKGTGKGRRTFLAERRRCEWCSHEFLASVHSIRAGGGRFCSMKCVYAWIGRRSPEERFWSYVNRTESCWLWIGRWNANGYGMLLTPNGRVRAPQFSWELHSGRPVPDGLWVLHKCDTPACVNPEHLFLGTRSDNMKDAAAKGRLAQQKNPERNKAARAKLAKLSPDDVRAIRLRHAEGGITLEAIGVSYGVTKHAVWRVVHGKVWTDIV